jgi:hypothetical protein
MRKFFMVAGTLLLGASLLIVRVKTGAHHPPKVSVSEANAASDGSRPFDACTPPDRVVGSAEETAWRLWVAATCPVNSNRYPYVVWENWIEQKQMYPVDPANGLRVPNSFTGDAEPTHRFHSNLLAFLRAHGTVPGPDEECNPANNPPSNNPDLVICEEVRLNGATEDYIASRNLWNRQGQQAVAAAGGEIDFPAPSVEVKVDWLVLDSCENPPQGVHVEKIEEKCYALAGMHLSSKLEDDWLWATFEPQNLDTNPNRCVVLGCDDPWGSDPPKTHGGPTGNTALTKHLFELMTQANLAPEWFNYRLNGVQLRFEKKKQPTLLGSSIIEGENVGMPLEQASCITCHDVSSIKNDGTDGITLLNSDPIGLPAPLPSDAWIRRDFVWSLGLACPNSLFQTCQ